MAVCAAIASVSYFLIPVFHCTIPAIGHTTRLWSRTLHADSAPTSSHRWSARSIVVALITLSFSVSFHVVLTIILVRRSTASSSSGRPLFYVLRLQWQQTAMPLYQGSFDGQLSYEQAWHVRSFSVLAFFYASWCPWPSFVPLFSPSSNDCVGSARLAQRGCGPYLVLTSCSLRATSLFSTRFTNPSHFTPIVSCSDSIHAMSLRRSCLGR